MKLSDYKNEEAIEVLADLIEPAAKIMSDKSVQKAFNAKKPIVLVIKEALISQKEAVVEFVAALHRSTPDEYSFTIPTLITDLMDTLNDPEIASLFTPQDTVTSSGSVTENTEEKEV